MNNYCLGRQDRLVCVGVVEAHDRYVTACAFSHDAAYLLTASGDRSD